MYIHTSPEPPLARNTSSIFFAMRDTHRRYIIHVYIYICIFIYMCVNVYTYIHVHTYLPRATACLQEVLYFLLLYVHRIFKRRLLSCIYTLIDLCTHIYVSIYFLQQHTEHFWFLCVHCIYKRRLLSCNYISVFIYVVIVLFLHKVYLYAWVYAYMWYLHEKV